MVFQRRPLLWLLACSGLCCWPPKSHGCHTLPTTTQSSGAEKLGLAGTCTCFAHRSAVLCRQPSNPQQGRARQGKAGKGLARNAGTPLPQARSPPVPPTQSVHSCSQQGESLWLGIKHFQPRLLEVQTHTRDTKTRRLPRVQGTAALADRLQPRPSPAETIHQWIRALGT